MIILSWWETPDFAENGDDHGISCGSFRNGMVKYGKIFPHLEPWHGIPSGYVKIAIENHHL